MRSLLLFALWGWGLSSCSHFKTRGISGTEEDDCAVESCGNPLESKDHRLSFARFRELKGNVPSVQQYMWKDIFIERISPVSKGRYDAVTRYEWALASSLGSYTTQIIGVRTHNGSADMNFPSPESIVLDSLNGAMERGTDYCFEVYGDRRPHWTPAFRAKLRETAIEYLQESTYAFVEERNGQRVRPLRGVIRLIREKNGRVPMEKYLDIEVDVGNKLKVEPGNLAVAREFNDDVWPEVILQSVTQAAREIVPGRENHYLTYADSFSLPMYSKLGFKPIDPSRIKLGPGVQLIDGKIFKDGVYWTPMEATQAELEGVLDFYNQRLARRGKADTIEMLKARRNELKSMEGFNGVYRIGRTPGEKAKSVVQLIVDYSHPGRIRFLLSINPPSPNAVVGVLPIDVFPLKMGEIPGSLDFKATYQNGVLRFENPYTKAFTEIETSSDLSIITRVRRVLKDPRSASIEAKF
jgi:hypothetical protein